MKYIFFFSFLLPFADLIDGIDQDFNSVYLDARCLATCTSEFSPQKPMEHDSQISLSPWPLFQGAYNEDILLCYYSCNQCDQQDTPEKIGCVSSNLAPCVAGTLFCREDSFHSCNGSKPVPPSHLPSVTFSYADFHTIEVSWGEISNFPLSQTEDCQSYTTFVLRLRSFDDTLFYMVQPYSTKIQLFNSFVNSFSVSFNVSVGAVNKVGFSGFGPTKLFVLRNSDPGPVLNIRYSIAENGDFPDEYTLLLKWDIPKLNYQNLISFSLLVSTLIGQPKTCEKFYFVKENHTVQLNQTTTSYLFQHQDTMFGPISECIYNFKIYSLVSIFSISFSEVDIVFPFICTRTSQELLIYFSYLPYDRMTNFVRIVGNWNSIENVSVVYAIKFIIFFANDYDTHITITQETSSNYIVVSSEDVAVSDVFYPPIQIHFEIEAHLATHMDCIITSNTGQAILNDHFPTVPSNFSVRLNESDNVIQIFSITWDEPTDFGGPLTGYQLVLRVENFYIDEQILIYNFTIEDFSTIIVLENATQVSVKIRAANIYGYGLFTDSLIFQIFNVSFLSTELPSIPSRIDFQSDYTLRILLTIFSPLTLLFLVICILLVIFVCVISLKRRHRVTLHDATSMFTIDDFEIPLAQLHFLHQLLGVGAFGFVRKAILKKNSKSALIVAVKITKDDCTQSEICDLYQEILMMKKIGSHPHIVKFYGCITQSHPICLILEFVPYGDLLALLRKLEAENNASSDLNYIKWFGLLTQFDMLDFAYQIAHGMQYISSLKLVHRDLACRNILVGENKQLKICDFGLSREVEVESGYCSENKEYYRLHFHRDKLPVRWMALESITESIFSMKSDVWSYGITLWEITSYGKTPYSSIPNSSFLQHILSKNFPEMPSDCTPQLYEMMCCCWHESPKSRPCFTDLIDKILVINDTYQNIAKDSVKTSSSAVCSNGFRLYVDNTPPKIALSNPSELVEMDANSMEHNIIEESTIFHTTSALLFNADCDDTCTEL